jgi:hypothetical protein
MKMQIAFRESSEIRHGHSVAIAGGVVEIGPDEWQDFEEKALAFKFTFIPALDHPVAVSAVGEPRRVVARYDYIENTLRVGTLEDLLTTDLERAIPNDHHNADFVLRETELPSSVDGGIVFAFSGLLHLKPGQTFNFENLLWFENVSGDPEHRMVFAGRSGLERRFEEGSVDMVARMRGEAMSALLRDALWGFGDEAYGLPGTMRLENYHKLDRYQELVFADDRTPEEDAEFNELRAFMRYAGLDTLEKDETFRRFVKEMRDQFPEFNGNYPMTADQMIGRDESIKAVISNLLEREDAPYSEYGR